MSRRLVVPLVLAVLAAATVAQAQGSGDAKHMLWPMPTSVTTTGDGTLTLTRNVVKFVSVGASSDVLEHAFERYHDLLFPSAAGQQQQQQKLPKLKAALTEIHVNVVSTDTSLRSGVDESYVLSLKDSPIATINAATVWGAIHALETLSQLVTGVSESESTIVGVPLTINDNPRFPHRGLLVDSSRNFLDKASLLRAIDGLAYSKMNVLHWHLTDSQSFPYEVKAYERLSSGGAYSNQEIYSPLDIAEVVQYGYMRGVKVMPEFDSPGHANAGFNQYPNVTVCPNFTPYFLYCLQPPCGQLNPSNELTYEILNGILTQASTDFPFEFVHLGFDEVNENCFMSDAGLVAWMKAQGMTTIEELLQYHADRLLAITQRLGRTPVFWQEAFDDGLSLPANSILQIWNQPSSLVPILQSGYRAILSNYEAWYLDCGHGGWLTGGDQNWCEYNGWRTVYLNEPVPDEIADQPEVVSRLLGGEVCSWGESVDSVSQDNRVWPRAAAAGERLWSPKDVRDVNNAIIRLEAHRNRLVSRGIDAAALRPKWCEQNPGGCEPDSETINKEQQLRVPKRRRNHREL